MDTSEWDEIPTDSASSIQNCPLKKRVRMNAESSVSATRTNVMIAHMGMRRSREGIRSSKFGSGGLGGRLGAVTVAI
jgi:hypothetical protein